MRMVCLSVRLSVRSCHNSRTALNFLMKLGLNILRTKTKVEFEDGHPGSKGTGVIQFFMTYKKLNGVEAM